MRSEPVNDKDKQKGEKRFLTADRFSADDTDWSQGHRVVEFDHLANQLRSCKLCSQPLQLHKIPQEHCYVTVVCEHNLHWKESQPTGHVKQSCASV